MIVGSLIESSLLLVASVPMVGIVTGGMLTALAIGAGTSLIGGGMASRSQSKAADKAAKAQKESTAESLKWEREQEATRKIEFAQTEAENKRRWEQEVAREEARSARDFGYQASLDAEQQNRWDQRQPHRTAALAAVADLDTRRKGSMADLFPIGRI